MPNLQGIGAAQAHGEAFDRLLSLLADSGEVELESRVRAVERAMQDFEERIGDLRETEPIVALIGNRIKEWLVGTYGARTQAGGIDPQFAAAMRQDMEKLYSAIIYSGNADEASARLEFKSSVGHFSTTQAIEYEIDAYFNTLALVRLDRSIRGISLDVVRNLYRAVCAPSSIALTLASLILGLVSLSETHSPSRAIASLFGSAALVGAMLMGSSVIRSALRYFVWERGLTEELNGSYSKAVSEYLRRSHAL
jgi:hypothetical protein